MTEHVHSYIKSLLTIKYFTLSHSRSARPHLYFKAEASTGTTSSIIPLPLRFLTRAHSWHRLWNVSSSQQLDVCPYVPYLKEDLVNDLLTISKY